MSSTRDSDEDRAAMVSRVQIVTGLSENAAQTLLFRSRYNEEHAVNSHFESSEEPSPSVTKKQKAAQPQSQLQPPPPPTPPSPAAWSAKRSTPGSSFQGAVPFRMFGTPAAAASPRQTSSTRDAAPSHQPGVYQQYAFGDESARPAAAVHDEPTPPGHGNDMQVMGASRSWYWYPYWY